MSLQITERVKIRNTFDEWDKLTEEQKELTSFAYIVATRGGHIAGQLDGSNDGRIMVEWEGLGYCVTYYDGRPCYVERFSAHDRPRMGIDWD